jgi:hypothetical protein
MRRKESKSGTGAIAPVPLRHPFRFQDDYRKRPIAAAFQKNLQAAGDWS